MITATTRGQKSVRCQNLLVTIPPAGVQTPVWEFTAVLNVGRKHGTVNIPHLTSLSHTHILLCSPAFHHNHYLSTSTKLAQAWSTDPIIRSLGTQFFSPNAQVATGLVSHLISLFWYFLRDPHVNQKLFWSGILHAVLKLFFSALGISKQGGILEEPWRRINKSFFTDGHAPLFEISYWHR